MQEIGQQIPIDPSASVQPHKSDNDPRLTLGGPKTVYKLMRGSNGQNYFAYNIFFVILSLALIFIFLTYRLILELKLWQSKGSL